MQMVFQDPFASLNPRHSVGRIVGEPLRVHGLVSGRKSVGQRVRELLERRRAAGRRGDPLPARVQRRPAPAHRACAGTRAQPRLRRRGRAGVGPRRLDPGADRQPDGGPAGGVRADVPVHRPRPRRRPPHLDRIAVMYLGWIVEVSPADELYDNPLHPYTISLLSAVPIPDPAVERERQSILLPGDLPSPREPAGGVPLPHALPVRAADPLPRRGAAAAAARRLTAPGRLPLGGEDQGGRDQAAGARARVRAGPGRAGRCPAAGLAGADPTSGSNTGRRAT